MSRCRACNRKLLEVELLNKNSNGEPEDICNICKPIVFSVYSYTGDHEYQYENLVEGLEQPLHLNE